MAPEHVPERRDEESSGDGPAAGGSAPGDKGRRALPALLTVLAVGVVTAIGAARSDGLESVRSEPTVRGADDPAGVASEVGDTTDERDDDLFVPVAPSGSSLVDAAGGTDGYGTPLTDGSATTADAPPTEPVSTETIPPTAPPQDPDAPSVVARPVPAGTPDEPPPAAPPPAWAGTAFVTPGGHLSTDVGCVPSGAANPSAAELDAFFAARVGPVIGWDYQHVYPLGGGRHLWLFQDAFIDHSGGAVTLGQASFAHNVALLQEGGCFRLLHRGSPDRPEPFETGTGSRTLSTWFWPMGGEARDGRLQVFWVQMVKDAVDPSPPDGLGWHPSETWVATYDPTTLARTDFRRAANPGVTPIYGYAVASDESFTYLFGNTFEQNLAREGGYWSGRHSATRMYLARVPLGRLSAVPEYRTADGWANDASAAVPILDRHWAEFPFQPRYIDGQWVGVAAVNGYWGDEFSVDVARRPWGPWATVEARPIQPRAGDPSMNTYHAHLAPWRDGSGRLVVTMSNNARDMRRDAWPHPYRYRPVAFTAPWVAAPATPAPVTSTTSTTTTTVTTVTTSSTTPSTTSTTPSAASTSTTTTTVAPSPTTTSTSVSTSTTGTTSTTAEPAVDAADASTSTSTATPTGPPDASGGAQDSGG